LTLSELLTGGLDVDIDIAVASTIIAIGIINVAIFGIIISIAIVAHGFSLPD
jgi:hypothetical protein